MNINNKNNKTLLRPKLVLIFSLVLFTLVSNSQTRTIFSISEHNPNSHVVHAIDANGYLFSIMPAFNERNDSSGFKIYKSNKENNLVDSLVVSRKMASTYVTNFIKISDSVFTFAVSIDAKPSGIRIYKANTLLQLLDSIDIVDNNFLYNNFSFANLIQGPEKEFLLNAVFYNGDLPFNMYYQIDSSFRIKNQFMDSCTIHTQFGPYSEITVNIIYFNNAYLMMSLADPLSMNRTHTVKRFSRNLDLLSSKKVIGSYFHNIYHSPMVINKRWFIGSVFRMMFGNDSDLMPNFIEINDDDSIIIKSNYFKQNVSFSGGNSVSNFNSYFDSSSQKAFLVANIGAPDETWHFCYDTSFNLIWKKIYTYPVNKADTIYTKMYVNGILWYNNQLYLYGVKQEFLIFNLYGPNKPFIVPVSMLDVRIVMGEKKLESDPIVPIVYPNPFIDELNFKEIEEKFTLFLFNPMGDMVLSKSFERDFKIRVDELESGLYFYKLQTANGQFHSGKIVKE